MLIALQGAVSQGVLWGIMVLGVFITFRLLDIPDMTCCSPCWPACAPAPSPVPSRAF